MANPVSFSNLADLECSRKEERLEIRRGEEPRLGEMRMGSALIALALRATFGDSIVVFDDLRRDKVRLDTSHFIGDLKIAMPRSSHAALLARGESNLNCVESLSCMTGLGVRAS